MQSYAHVQNYRKAHTNTLTTTYIQTDTSTPLYHTHIPHGTYYTFHNEERISFSLLDPFNGEEWKITDNGLKYGCDMVKFIRENFGDFFTICVAGIY